MASEAEVAATRRAFTLSPPLQVPLGPNPGVGAVLIDPQGRTVAKRFHRRAGSPHAKAATLAAAPSSRGVTAVVTLEPCNHVGRSGPCAQALVSDTAASATSPDLVHPSTSPPQQELFS